MGRSYHRSSSSSSISSSSSNRSDRSVESITCNVSRKKVSGALVYLAGGDPRKHKHIRKDVTTIEYADGTCEYDERVLLVRDPYGATYYFTYEDDRSQYRSESRSSRRSSRSSRGSQAGSRGPSAMGGGVPVMPQPRPMPMPQQGQPFMGGQPGGMPPMGEMGMGMGMPPPPMMHQGHPGINVVDGMDFDDAHSEYSSSSGSSYYSEEDEFEPHHQQMPPMNNMHMPPNFQPPPPPMQHGAGGGLGPDGPGFIQIG